MNLLCSPFGPDSVAPLAHFLLLSRNLMPRSHLPWGRCFLFLVSGPLLRPPQKLTFDGLCAYSGEPATCSQGLGPSC